MENIKQINIYLVDGSRYVVIPSDDNLAKYVKGNFYGGYNIGISKMKRNQLFMSGCLMLKDNTAAELMILALKQAILCLLNF